MNHSSVSALTEATNPRRSESEHVGLTGAPQDQIDGSMSPLATCVSSPLATCVSSSTPPAAITSAKTGGPA
jgi:hypothetical protein